jgi:hypothetical protein
MTRPIWSRLRCGAGPTSSSPRPSTSGWPGSSRWLVRASAPAGANCGPTRPGSRPTSTTQRITPCSPMVCGRSAGWGAWVVRREKPEILSQVRNTVLQLPFPRIDCAEDLFAGHDFGRLAFQVGSRGRAGSITPIHALDEPGHPAGPVLEEPTRSFGYRSKTPRRSDPDPSIHGCDNLHPRPDARYS